MTKDSLTPLLRDFWILAHYLSTYSIKLVIYAKIKEG